MRVACVLITHLRAKAEMRRQTDLKESSTLVVDGGRATGKRDPWSSITSPARQA